MQLEEGLGKEPFLLAVVSLSHPSPRRSTSYRAEKDQTVVFLVVVSRLQLVLLVLLVVVVVVCPLHTPAKRLEGADCLV